MGARVEDSTSRLDTPPAPVSLQYVSVGFLSLDVAVRVASPSLIKFASLFNHAQAHPLIVLALAGTLTLSGSGRAAGPKFFDDDPISRDPETQDASRVQPIEISQQFDYVENSFFKPGDRASVRAVNVNTLDEVPDSSWFTNRAGGARWVASDAAGAGFRRGSGGRPVDDRVRRRTEGVTPGMTIRDWPAT